MDSSPSSDSAAVVGNIALEQLSEFDDLFSRVGDQSAVHNILKKDSNLEQVLIETEKRQESIFDSFIDQHCEQIPLLCAMFDEITRCENKLLDFEESIASYQERLTSTAESISAMQQETVCLRTRVSNRRDVSDKLKQVYEALHETERFCDAIASATVVDEQFLMSIRLLESKIAFLADNEELSGSAIENEMRPKLTAAAHRAGDKLHEFLVRKLSSLTAENANISLHQQAIERQGQYAFSFLSKYNSTIASEITTYYTQIMTEVFTRVTRAACKAYESVATDASMKRSFEPFVTIEVVTSFCGTGATRFVDPRTLPLVNRVQPQEAMMAHKKEKTFSESFKSFFSSNKSSAADTAAAAGRRPAVFADFVHVLQGLEMASARTMGFDPLIAQMLSKSACWVHNMTTMLVKLVNNVVSEGRFLDHFFFLSTPATDREEAMLSSIFAEPLRMVVDLVKSQVMLCNDAVSLLTAHRVIELAKNFVTQSCNPIPIMLLTMPFEHMFSCIAHRLTELTDLQLENLRAFASCAPFQKFAAATAAATASHSRETARFVDLVQTDRQLSAVLGPNEVVRRFASLGGQIVCINTLKVDGSRVSATSLDEYDRIAYDDPTSEKMMAAVSLMANIIESIASCHVTALAKSICKVNCIGHIFFVWKHLEPAVVASPTSSTASPIAGGGSVAGAGGNNTNAVVKSSSSATGGGGGGMTGAATAAASSPSVMSGRSGNSGAAISAFSEKDRLLVDGTSSYTLLSRECRLLDEILKQAISDFVFLDATSVDIFDPVLQLLESCKTLVEEQQRQQQQQSGGGSSGGAGGGASPSSSLPSAPTAATAGSGSSNNAPPMSEQELLAVLVPFHKGWLEALTAVVQRLRVYFSDGEGPYQLVVKEYFSFLVDKVRKLHTLVSKCYPKSTAVKSKTVGPQTFWNEVTRLMT